ncbi:hypothetical protein BDV96DRAFT_645399 [Lophiotrema nucula]|uniref:Uncharacterized protein n=1 Tax=Lophiotrema nucula TaxID=690887 RepID=A0A6A5ZCD8_9PLEO|nr:hypothetical protein BDV96DRAFT_645399 [Lophiotrema nucula]
MVDTLPALHGLYEAVAALLQTTLDVADVGARHSLRVFRLLQVYDLSGLFLFMFGSEMTWRLEAQVLGQMADDDALAFKKYVQAECTMIFVAAAIMAQISITALSLSNIGDIH